MPGRRFWILAASLGLALTSVAADPAPPIPKPGFAPPNIEADSFVPEEGGKIVVATNARLKTKDSSITAKRIRFDTRTGIISADGNVVYATGSLRIMGEKVVVNPQAETIDAYGVRFGRSPIYFTAEELHIIKGDKSMKGVHMWNSEPDPLGMDLVVGEMKYTEKENWLSLKGVTPQLAGVPFFYLPSYGQEGYQDIPYDVYIDSGSTDLQGRFLRSSFLMRTTPTLWVGGLLDYYSKSGLLIGPSVRFDSWKKTGEDFQWKGRFQAGYINDRGDLAVDVYGRTPDRNRAFALGEINGRSTNGLEIAGAVFAETDPNFIRDFRPNLINQSGIPQANIEASLPFAGGYLSANITAKADNFSDTVQKLPELRFDLPQNALGTDGWQQRSFVSLGYFSERPSASLPLAAFQAATLASDAWSTARLDAYYGISRPIVLADWLTFKPVAGVRTTGWSSGINNNGATTKVIGQAGFDLEGLATGSWALMADKWSIDGMRHTIRPLFQYRVMPGADGMISSVPMTERAISSSVLQEVDLADRLDAASVTDTQVARFGIRNTLETRDAKYGTRELLRADLFTDWHKGPTEATTGRTDMNVAIQLTPAPWVTLGSSLRLPNAGGAPLESIQTLGFNSGDFWKTSINWVELRDVTVARQLIWNGTVRLNSIFSLVAQLNYDALAKQASYESIGLVQRIGNSWELEYGVDQRLDPLNGGHNSLGFHLRATLFKF